MKKIILLTIILMSFLPGMHAQIILENTYTTDQLNQPITKLSLSGVKYVSLHYTNLSADYFKLFNLDHTTFRTIPIPQIAGKNANTIGYISETLFALDSLIEYMVLYRNLAGTSYSTYIYNESGAVVFYEPNGIWANGITSTPPPVVSVGDSTKLILGIALVGANFDSTRVYSLPGKLTCFDCTNGVISAITVPNEFQRDDEYSLPFPNPSSEEVTIKYNMPLNYRQAFINIFNIYGQLIKTIAIDKNSGEIKISNKNFAPGQYFYSITVDNKIVERNKYIVVK